MALNQPTVMILGAGLYQVPVIHRAAALGFRTVAVSVDGAYPGFDVADKSFRIDVRDRHAILELARAENICGVMTDGTDMPVPTVAYVAENLGLPGVGYECARTFTDKERLHDYCRGIGVPVPTYAAVTRLADAMDAARDIGFPLVVKPVDNQGSRGVHRLARADGLAAAFAEAACLSADGRVLLERFIQGREVYLAGIKTPEGFTHLLAGDRRNFDLPGRLIFKDGLIPADIPETTLQRLCDWNRRLVESLNPLFCNTYTEFVVEEETDEVYLIEAGARGGGGYLSSHHVPLLTGVDGVGLMIEFATGRRQTAAVRPAPQAHGAGGYVTFLLPAGTIRRVAGVERVRHIGGVLVVSLDGLAAGVKVPPCTDKSSRWGPILFAADDRAACLRIVDRIRGSLEVEVDTPAGPAPMVW